MPKKPANLNDGAIRGVWGYMGMPKKLFAELFAKHGSKLDTASEALVDAFLKYMSETTEEAVSFNPEALRKEGVFSQKPLKDFCNSGNSIHLQMMKINYQLFLLRVAMSGTEEKKIQQAIQENLRTLLTDMPYEAFLGTRDFTTEASVSRALESVRTTAESISIHCQTSSQISLAITQLMLDESIDNIKLTFFEKMKENGKRIPLKGQKLKAFLTEVAIGIRKGMEQNKQQSLERSFVLTHSGFSHTFSLSEVTDFLRFVKEHSPDEKMSLDHVYQAYNLGKSSEQVGVEITGGTKQAKDNSVKESSTWQKNIFSWAKNIAKATLLFSKFSFKERILSPYGWRDVNYSLDVKGPVKDWLNKGAVFLSARTSLDVGVSKKVVDKLVPVFVFDGIVGVSEDIYAIKKQSLDPFFEGEQYSFTTDSLDGYLHEKPLYRDFVFVAEENGIFSKEGDKAAEKKKLQQAFYTYRREAVFTSVVTRARVVFEKSIMVVGKKFLEKPFVTVVVVALASITYLAIGVHVFLHEGFLVSVRHANTHSLSTKIKTLEKRLRRKRRSLFLSKGALKEVVADEQFLRNLQQLVDFSEKEHGEDVAYLQELADRPERLVLGVFQAYLAASGTEKETILNTLRDLDCQNIVDRSLEHIERKHTPFLLMLKQIRTSFWSYFSDYKKNIGLLLLVSVLHMVLSVLDVPLLVIWLVLLTIVLSPYVAEPVNAFVDQKVLWLYVRIFRPFRQKLRSLDWLMEVSSKNKVETESKDKFAKGLLELVDAADSVDVVPKDIRQTVVQDTVFSSRKKR